MYVYVLLCCLTGESWKVSFDFVKTQRRICSPNTAFTVNLIELTELLNGDASRATLLYRLAYHAPYDPETPVLKLCRNESNRRILVPATSLLNPKAVFVLRAVRPSPSASSSGGNGGDSDAAASSVSSSNAAAATLQHTLFIWVGNGSSTEARGAAVQLARQMIDVLSQAKDVTIVREGEEGSEFLSCLAADGPFQRHNAHGVALYNDYYGSCQPTESELQEAASLRFAASSVTQEFLRTMGTSGPTGQASQSSLGSETAPPTSATVSRNNSNAKLSLHSAAPLPLATVAGTSSGAGVDDRSHVGGVDANASLPPNPYTRSRSNTVLSTLNAELSLSIPAALSRANSFSSVDSDGQPVLSREERLNRIHNIIDAAVNSAGHNVSSSASPMGGGLQLSLSNVPGPSVSVGIGGGSARSSRRRSSSKRHRPNDDSSASENEHEGSSLSSMDSPMYANRNKDNDGAADRGGDSESSRSFDRYSEDPGEEAKALALGDVSKEADRLVVPTLPATTSTAEKAGGLSLSLPLLAKERGPSDAADAASDGNASLTSSMQRSSSKPRFVPAIGLYPLTEATSQSNSAINTSRPPSAAPSSSSRVQLPLSDSGSLAMLGTMSPGQSSSRAKLMPMGLSLPTSSGAASPSESEPLPLSRPGVAELPSMPPLSLSLSLGRPGSAALSSSAPVVSSSSSAEAKAPTKPLLFQASSDADDDADDGDALGRWVAMGVYDDEDLDDANALLLLCPGPDHYVWLGTGSALHDAYQADGVSADDLGSWLARRVGGGETSEWRVDWTADTFHAEVGGEESESFWEKFNEGF